MEASESHWGADAVDPNGPNLPALKTKYLLDHVPLRGKVVELGSGDGKLLRTLAHHRPELELLGCDIRKPQTKPDVYTFHLLTDERLPFETGSLDAVLIFDVLEHVPDPAGLLAEAARVLRSGGRLVAFVPVEGEKLSFYELYRIALGREVYAETKEHIQAFTHAELRGLIERHFVVNEIEYAYHVLGQLMDASFFAATRLPFLRSFWWNDNAYYNKAPKKSSVLSGALNTMLKLGNGAAWAESTLLKRTRAGSAGILVEATVTK